MNVPRNPQGGKGEPIRPPGFQKGPIGIVTIVNCRKLTTGATLLSVRINSLAVVVHGVVIEPAAGFTRVVLPGKKVHTPSGGRTRRPIVEAGAEFRGLILKALEQYRAEHPDLA